LAPLILGFLVAVFVPNIIGKNKAENVDTLNTKIETALKIGASKNEIDKFLVSTLWVHTYDEFSSRFVATPAEGQSECKGRNLLMWLFYDCGIQIFINLDKAGLYKGHKVEQVYSGL